MSSEATIMHITAAKFKVLLDVLARDGKVYTPQAASDRLGVNVYPFKLSDAENRDFTYHGFRPSQPLKTFLFAGRMKVAEYPGKNDADTKPSGDTVYIVGAASCDIESLKSLDAVFLEGEYADIFYRERRENTIIITADCTSPRASCFCTLAGHAPSSAGGFDLNLSKSGDGFIVEAGSERGEKLLSVNKSLFTNVDADKISVRSDDRSKVKSEVAAQNKQYALSASRRSILEKQRESDDWFESVKTCVECGACLFSCPTCHCFLLHDQAGTSNGTSERFKEWDVCVYAGFSRMAGGSSPRLGLMERFRHRYLHKLEYFPKNFGFEACTGCGRCIEGCMGKIDMRKVLNSLDSETVGAD